MDLDFLDDPNELIPQRKLTTDTRPVIRMSHSSRLSLHSCERKYYLTRYKAVDAIATVERDTSKNNVHLDFGSALGIGIQKLLETQDIEQGVWAAITAYNFAEENYSKNVKSLVYALMSFHAQWDYDEWEYIKGEASFKLILNQETGDYSCGYMDCILRNKSTGLYTVVEIKTTGNKAEDLTPMYMNSDQGIGYSLILDAVAPNQTTFHVLYLVLQLKYRDIRVQWHFFPFLKSEQHKLEFLLTQQMDYQYLQALEKLDYWPMRGNACTSFGKPCFLLNVCHLHTMNELPFLEPREEDDWDYVFNIDELLESLL